MIPVDGIELTDLLEDANKAVAGHCRKRLVEYLQGLLKQRHNLRMKAARLEQEVAQAEAQADEIDHRITRIAENDWSVIEPIDLSA